MSVAHAPHLPAALISAVDRLGQAASAICEQCRQSLALSALALPPGLRRERAQEAPLVLTREAATFQSEFTRAFTERLQRQWVPDGVVVGDGPTSWDSWSLVDDREIEQQVAAQRLGHTMGQACEWELRELDGYLRALRGPGLAAAAGSRPGVLQPDAIGFAVLKALEALAADAEIRKLLAAELATTWSAHLARTYTQIIADLRAAGVTPASIATRSSLAAPAARTRSGGFGSPAGSGFAASAASGSTGAVAGGAFTPSRSSHTPSASAPLHPGSPREPDPGLTGLLREWIEASDRQTALRDPVPLPAGVGHPAGAASAPTPAAAFANLIDTHRDELSRTLKGPLDQLIIDVVGALFEQILADPNVPAAIAQQIGRLQLPVLRNALADPAFFASRRHPVRLLVNRLASLGLALDDLEPAAADALVRRIRDAVHDIVHGDFEQPALYQRTLADLEQFVAEMGRREIEHEGAQPQLLAEREADLQVQLRTARAVRAELQPLPVPGFLRDFVSDVWSRVLLARARDGSLDGEAARDARQVVRELLLSVQPKGTPEQRKDFVSRLPRLMQAITTGLDEIGWPAAARHDFFGQLLPAHAQSLRGDAMRTLDHNLLVRQIELALDAALARGRQSDARGGTAAIPLDSAPAPLMSSLEASSVGLVAEDQVDWSGPLHEPEVGASAPLDADELAIEGLPRPEPPEPTQGRSLADHLQVGVVYRMHLEGEWHQVRLTHVSPGRVFYVFARGRRHRRVISLTHRMLVRMCESGRLRALEAAYLLERATARARQQLERLNRAPASERG